MSLLHRTPSAHIAEPEPDSGPPATPETVIQPAANQPVPRTRTGAAWVAVCVAALITVALIVFLVQNTRSVEVSFLWMTTSTSLALGLLIAAVGAVLLTLVLGTARITQLRRHTRRRTK